MIILLGSCKTTDQAVEKMVFQRATATIKQSDPYKSSFTQNIQGSYEMSDNEIFTVDGTGFFKIGETEFSLYETLNESQAVYVSAEPTVNNRKKVYTYHGITVTGTQVLTVAHKVATSVGDTRLLTEKDTEYAWAVNTFQVKNINWENGLSTVFGTKTDSQK
jgi:hypothetical protein